MAEVYSRSTGCRVGTAATEPHRLPQTSSYLRGNLLSRHAFRNGFTVKLCRLRIHPPVAAQTTHSSRVRCRARCRLPEGAHPCLRLLLLLDSPDAQGTPVRQLHGENPCSVESSSPQETRSRKFGNVGTYIRKGGSNPTRGFPRNGPTASSARMHPASPRKSKFVLRLDSAGTE